MTTAQVHPYTAPLSVFDADAARLYEQLLAGNSDAAWAFKWMLRRYRGQHVSAVRADDLTLDDARTVVANNYAFEAWADLAAFTAAVTSDTGVQRFERAVEAVLDGDMDTLTALIAEHPGLVSDRSQRRHHATLLHYLGANGVEVGRQRSAPNAPAVARLLLQAGADADALAHLYDQECTTMSMLLSSSPPHDAGVTIGIVDALLDHGAGFSGPGTGWSSAVRAALLFGFPDTARHLVARGAPVATLEDAAGLGDIELVRQLLPAADADQRHRALALAAQLGQSAVVALLLDAGESPDRYNPDGYHSHSTPMHQAVWGNHREVVELLIARGARLDLPDTLYDGTPLDWARYGERQELVALLQAHDAPST